MTEPPNFDNLREALANNILATSPREERWELCHHHVYRRSVEN